MPLGRHDSLEKIDYFDTNHTIVNNFNNGPVENSSFNEELRLADDVFEDLKLTMTNFLSTVCVVYWIMKYQFSQVYIYFYFMFIYIYRIFLFQIITKQMSETYGEAEWKIYVIIKPPWTMITALKCAIKHWIAAINESFQRRAEYILKELQDAFLHVPGILINITCRTRICILSLILFFSVGGRQLEGVEYILEKSSDLVQAVNMDKHSNLVTQTFDTITVIFFII